VRRSIGLTEGLVVDCPEGSPASLLSTLRLSKIAAFMAASASFFSLTSVAVSWESAIFGPLDWKAALLNGAAPERQNAGAGANAWICTAVVNSTTANSPCEANMVRFVRESRSRIQQEKGGGSFDDSCLMAVHTKSAAIKEI